MAKKWLALMLTLIVLLMTMPLLAACDDDDDEEDTKTVQPTETATPTETKVPMKEEELNIGWLASFTGQSATQRDYSIDLAIKEINEAGGVQVGNIIYKLDLEIEGDQMTAAGAVSGIQKLLYEKNAKIVIHGNMSGPYVVRPYAEEEKALQFTINQPEGFLSPEHPYSFWSGSDNALFDLFILDWVSENRPDIKTIAGIKTISTEAEIVARTHRKLAPAEYGIEYTGYEFFDVATRDFYPILTKALKGDPDAIIVDNARGFMVVKQARELGFEGQVICAGDMPEHWYPMLTNEELDGILSLSPPVDSPQVLQSYKDYLEAYYEMRNATPYDYEYGFMVGYVTTYIYVAAVKAAGSTDPDKVVEAMETQTLTLEFPGGDNLDIRFFGQEQFGTNHYLIPTPEYISVNRMDKPELLEVVDQDKQYEYRALYDKYRLAE